jgi:hypothetical protein
MVFISNNEATEVLQPGEQSLHFEATTISPQRTPILSGFSEYVRTKLRPINFYESLSQIGGVVRLSR